MRLNVYVEAKNLSWIVSVAKRAFEDNRYATPKMRQIVDDNGLITLSLETPYTVPSGVISLLKKIVEDEGGKNGASIKETLPDGSSRFSLIRRPPHIKRYGSETEMENLSRIIDHAYELHGHPQPQMEMVKAPNGKFYLDVKTRRIPNDVFTKIWEMIKTNTPVPEA